MREPPPVIPIDNGRQLFVDDYLIAKTDLVRTWHQARYHDACPVLRPDKPWERRGENPMAYPFSDGVWYDPEVSLYKLWYYCGNQRHTAYAQSRDGLNWEKPAFDVVRGTNTVMAVERDSTTVWMDLEDPDPARRFKMVRSLYHGNPLKLHTSPDGIRWSGELAASRMAMDDRTTAWYDPFRKVWVLSIRALREGVGRARQYYEAAEFDRLLRFRKGELRWWTEADEQDPVRPDIGVKPELYNLDGFPYESLMVGLFSIWQGHPQTRHKINEVFLGFARDGVTWDRPWREPFLPVSETPGAWNWTNVQSAGGGCVVRGDELWFYCSGRSGVPGSPRMGEASTGLAVLRRDGFASMDAGEEAGFLKTRLLRFSGKRLMVNADCARGELRAEILDRRGRVVEPYTEANSVPVTVDSTAAEMVWKGAERFPELRQARIRFRLRRGRLFSFWTT